MFVLCYVNLTECFFIASMFCFSSCSEGRDVRSIIYSAGQQTLHQRLLQLQHSYSHQPTQNRHTPFRGYTHTLALFVWGLRKISISGAFKKYHFFLIKIIVMDKERCQIRACLCESSLWKQWCSVFFTERQSGCQFPFKSSKNHTWVYWKAEINRLHRCTQVWLLCDSNKGFHSYLAGATPESTCFIGWFWLPVNECQLV